MSKKKTNFLIYFMYLLMIVFIVAFIGFGIYVWVKYGNLPPDEVPSWVHWLMVR